MKDIFNDEIIDYINQFKKIEPNLILSIGIIKNNQKSYFMFSNNNETINNDFLYDIGSITKVYTALVISYLINQNKLFLEDEMDKYLNLKFQTPTIEHLLTHTAYRPFISLKFMIRNFLKLNYFKNNPYHNKDEKYLLKYINKHKIKGKKDYFYSDINYAVLGNIISKIENDSYYNIMSNFIKDELKLSNTKFTFDFKNKLESYYRKKKAKPFVWSKDDVFLSAGGLSTNIYDSLSFIELCLKSNKDYIKQSLKPIKKILLNKYKMKIGYAWHITENGNLYYHRGAVGCYRSIYMFNKNSNLGIVILSNCIGNQLFNINKLSKQIYKNLK